jgi:TonB-dependent starch-binding outer membrane protein SusC
MKKKLFKKLLLLIVMMSGNVFLGQEIIKGKVESAGLPLPGVNIVIKGSSTGTTTDFDGTFVLKNVPPNSKLIITYIGYAAREVVADSKSFMMINLAGDTKALTEIVVVGYGTAKKKDVTGAVSSVTAKDLKDQPFTGLDQALQGRVSGVSVTQNSGAPGGGVSIRIRGVASLSSNEPLYVVDGVPIYGGDNNNSFDYNTLGSILGGNSGQTKVSALSAINPSDIESIDILKDASASAIYGSRASNGVVLITTKKGKKGKSTISYEAYTGIQQARKFLDVLNLRDYARYVSEISPILNRPVPYQFQNPDILGEGTNWQEEIFRDAEISNHQLTISGGKDNTRYYTSLNYFKQDGIVINSGFKRLSMRLNLDTKINDWFKIGNNLTIGNTVENVVFNDSEAGVISTAVSQSPNIPVRFSNGGFGAPSDGTVGSQGAANPVASAYYKSNDLSRYKLNGSLFGEISLTKSLSFKTVLGYDYTTTKGDVFIPNFTIGTIPSTSVSVKSQSQSFFWTVQNYFTYTKAVGKSNFVVLLGQEAQQNNYEGLSGSRTGYLSNEVSTLNAGDAATALNDNYKGRSSLVSYFTRLNYSFDNRYLLAASFRSDSSSNFGPGYKTGYFPSISAAWVISNESFFKGLDKTVSLLKVKAGYGEVGNQNIGAYKYGASISTYATGFGTAFSQENIQNPKVKWETTKSSNFGVELGLFSNIIRLDVDYFKKISSDFLFNEPVPAYLGTNPQQGNLGVSAKVVNLGDLENKGWDISLNTKNVSGKNFNWTSTLIFSAFQNKLLNFGSGQSFITRNEQNNVVITKTAAGYPVGQFFGYQVEGIYQSIADIQNSPTPDRVYTGNRFGVWVGDLKFKDINGDGKIDAEDQTYIGSPLPDFTYSVINNLSYKNVDLSVVFLGTQGNKIFNWTRRSTEGLGAGGAYSNQSAVVKDRAIVIQDPNNSSDFILQNPNTTIPRFVEGDPNGNIRVSDRFVEDGSYLRLQNVTIGYSFSSKLVDMTKFFSKIRLYLTGQNIYTFTKYKGLDPAVGSFSQDALKTGVDNGRYPVARVFTMGLNLDF